VDRGQAGSSPVTAVFGVGIFLSFLLLASQTLLHLYATTLVGSVVEDATRRAAAEAGGGCSDAGLHVRQHLGRHGDAAEIGCFDDGDQLHLQVQLHSPARLLPARLFDDLGPGMIERSASVRIERMR
jgi:hypothetical protein